MCGRYRLEQPAWEFSEVGIEINFDLMPRWNIAPTQEVPVVSSINKAEMMKWGITANFSMSSGRKSNLLINARCESVREKPAFKESFAVRRSLAPADGFYEWTKGRRPHLFTMKGNAPFALGGFFAEAPGMGRLCLLTTAANEILRPVHDRMPVIVRREDWEQWLEPGELEEQLFRRVTTPYAPEEMERREVGEAVNHVRNDGPECGRAPEPTLF